MRNQWFSWGNPPKMARANTLKAQSFVEHQVAVIKHKVPVSPSISPKHTGLRQKQTSHACLPFSTLLLSPGICIVFVVVIQQLTRGFWLLISFRHELACTEEGLKASRVSMKTSLEVPLLFLPHLFELYSGQESWQTEMVLHPNSVMHPRESSGVWS